MPISTAGSYNKQRGFTLLELSIVVLLLSLFAVLTIPILSRFNRDDLAWSARRLAGAVQYLFNEAAISGREHRLAIELDKNLVKAEIVEEGGEIAPLETWENKLELPEDVHIKDVRVAGRGQLAAGSATIRFLPGGYLEESLIHLTDRKRNLTLTLHLNPFTGATEIREGYHDF